MFSRSGNQVRAHLANPLVDALGASQAQQDATTVANLQKLQISKWE